MVKLIYNKNIKFTMKFEESDILKIQNYYDEGFTLKECYIHFNIKEWDIRKLVKNGDIKVRDNSKSQIKTLKYDSDYIKNSFDWQSIQKEYDNGKSSYDFNIPQKIFEKAKKLGLIKLRNYKDATLNRNNIKGTPKHTNESKIKLTKCGGYKKGCGRGKKGWYKGYWCDSTWELAYIIYNINNQIEFKRYDGSFNYIYNNKNYKYYPDFILNDNTIIEIKGYETEKDLFKYNSIDSNLYTLKILKKKDIEPMIKYVKNKFKIQNLYELYDGDINHKKDSSYNLCKCGVKKYLYSNNCKKCSSLLRRKTTRPDLDIILKDIKEFGYVGTGKKYNVSDNTIRKWIR